MRSYEAICDALASGQPVTPEELTLHDGLLFSNDLEEDFKLYGDAGGKLSAKARKEKAERWKSIIVRLIKAHPNDEPGVIAWRAMDVDEEWKAAVPPITVKGDTIMKFIYQQKKAIQNLTAVPSSTD